MPTRKQIDAEVRRLYAEETALFNLSPWQCPPLMARDPPDAPTSWGQSMPLARERRQKLLKQNPHRYDLADAEPDDPEPERMPRAAWSSDGSGWMQKLQR